MNPAIKHHFGGGVYAKQANIPAGQIVVKHKHNFDHLSILGSGVVRVEVDGHTRELIGPACITISKDKYHKVTAVTDCVWFCVHATDCTDEDAVDEILIAPESNVEEMLAIGAGA